MMGQSYRDLVAWQRAVDLVEHVYRITQDWPRDELYGLTNQARRAAVSIPANIAEGQGRLSDKEFCHHLSFAYGSLCELETHLIIARRLGYLGSDSHDVLASQATQVARPLRGLIRSRS
jgi:four helix bundle protein